MRSRDRATAILIAITLGVALAALGSAPRWATCVAALLALGAAAPQALSRRVATEVPPLLWLLAAAAAATALQLVPLPAALVGWIAPVRLEIVADNATALGHAPPSWLALSYDPPATLIELAKLVGYLGMAFACTRLAATGQGRRWLVHTVAAAGVAMAGVAALHHALGLDALFGVYQPRSAASSYLAPLLNENHLAGFLAFAVPLCLVLALEARAGRRLLWVAGAALCAGVALLTASRGGAVALAAGVALTAGLLVLQRRRHADRRAAPPRLAVLVPAGVVTLCGIVLLATFTAGGVRDELLRTSVAELEASESKLGVWRATSGLIGENLWTGVGRGGFELAFTRFHHAGIKTYSHVENEYLQALVDWGVIAAAALALLLVWTALSAFSRWHRSPLEVGAMSALAALALHSAVDFHLELPGVALAAVAVAALLVPMSVTQAPRQERRARALARSAALAAGALVIAAAASPLGRTAHAEGDALAALLRATDGAPEHVLAEARRAWQRHPADYLIAGLTAEAYFRARDRRAVDVMNRALALNPEHAGLHVLAARMLLAGGRRQQALIELSLALAHTPDPERVLADLLRFFPEPEEAARGMPTAAHRVPVMVNRLVTMGRPDVALAYARRAADDHPGQATILELLARLALDRGDLALALDSGERAHAARRSATSALAYGRALRAADRMEEARAVATAALDADDPDADTATLLRLYELLADAQIALREHRPARDTLRAAIGRSSGHPAMRAGFYRRLARVEDALGNAAAASEARKLAEEQLVP